MSEQAAGQGRQRLVIYTVLTGSKEPLGDPLGALPPGTDPGVASDLDISFVCFTDNRKLASKVWQMRYIDQIPLPPEKLSRRPKALPHEYLQDWDYSLYIDNITQFKRLPRASDLATSAPYLFKAFKHATRENPQQEAEAIVTLGYESADRICGQLDFYAKQFPLASIAPLSTCTVILRQHKHPAVIAFGVTWWEQILNFGKRDQMSFDFALRWNRTRLEHLPGLKHDNELIVNTANIQPNRVHANFDPVRYAWAHRGDAAAQANPRQHYLDHGRHDGRSYAAHPDLLEFFCHRHGAALGARIAPRRSVAGALQEMLEHRRGAAGRMLLVRVLDDGHGGVPALPTAFSTEELEHAETALCTYLPSHQGTRLDLTVAQLAEGKLALRPPGDGEGRYDLVLVIGAPGALLPQLHQLVVAQLAASGQMVVIATSPCLLGEAARIEAHLAKETGKRARASLHSSRHDALDQPLPNSLIGFEWAS